MSSGDLTAGFRMAAPNSTSASGDARQSSRGEVRMRHRNHGLRKRCTCPRKVWPKCSHSWYLNFKPKGGPHYQLSLDREVGRHVDSKSEAQDVAGDIRKAIRDGTFRIPIAQASPPKSPPLTFRAFAKIWSDQRGSQLVRPRDNE